MADLTHIALVLFLAFAGGLLMRQFRQPALIGYIVVGALIGPSMFGIQGDTQTVKWLSEIAILFLMFMIGLELDIHSLNATLRKSIVVTVLQIIGAVLAMIALSYVFDWSLAMSILFGFVIALSSTAVAMTLLSEEKAEGSPIATTAIGILIVQDLAVIPMLLVVSALGSGWEVATYLRLGIALGIIGVILFGIFELVRHPRWVDRLERLLTTGVSQPVIVGIALCFGAAALTGSLGLSTSFGAFAVGLLLGNIGSVGASYRKAVRSLHDLLLTIFFLSIGLMLDVPYLIENIMPVVAILSATLLLKTVGNALVLRITGSSVREALSVGSILGQIGEFSFVLIALGLSNGFLNHDTYQLALAVIALSLILSPLSSTLVRRSIAARSASVV